jgi:hypothetical protein
MRRFWLFRSNLIPLEYYHKYKDLKLFKNNCHDYYLLLPLWLLENDYFDEVTIWRLTKKPKDPIVFDIQGKKFIQRWTNNFKNTIQYPKPDMAFFRGGFRIYDQFTKKYPNFSKFKIYLGAGQRINAKWGGIYDLFLMEDDQDIINNSNTHPFYKTASPSVFFPYKKSNVVPSWDICWPCNFTQLSYKGQEFFIREVSKSPYLKSLKITHCGNKPQIGQRLCEKYGVKNIKFNGLLDKNALNHMLNYSKFGLNLSNRTDGCPRVSTEILMSETPLIIHEQTRLLSYYKKKGVVEVNDKNIAKKIKHAMENYDRYKDEVKDAIQHELSFDETNKKNIDLWNSLQKI